MDEANTLRLALQTGLCITCHTHPIAEKTKQTKYPQCVYCYGWTKYHNEDHWYCHSCKKPEVDWGSYENGLKLCITCWEKEQKK